METLKMRMVGTAALLMHNGQLADPTNEFTKAVKLVAGQKKKTDEQMLELKRLEWMGSFVQDEKGRPALKADQVLATIIEGARKSKRGKDAQAAVLVGGDLMFFPLEIRGPKTIEEIWQDARFCDYRSVVISGKRVMRARPIFKTWACTVEVLIDSEIINATDVFDAMRIAGERIGVGDFRPRYGRFSVERLAA